MFKRKRVKIYTHQNKYFETNDRLPMRRSFLAIMMTPFRIIFQLCYYVGFGLMEIVRSFSQLPQAGRQLKFSMHRRRWRSYSVSLNRRQTRLALTTFVLMIGVVSFAIHGALLVASGQKLKGQVLGAADQGLGHLHMAQDALQNQDSTAMSQQLQMALQSFQTSQQDLGSTNILLGSLLELTPQKHDADKLLQASTLLTEGGISWTKFYEISKDVSVTPQGITGKSGQSNVLADMNEQLQSGRTKINEAITLLEQIDPSSIPTSKRIAFNEARNKMEIARTGTAVIGEMFDLLVQITSGDKNVLLLFENNNELRPTGGFIGTYGAMRLQNGQINSLHISSIYDLDGQLKQTILPPQPIQAVNNKWFMRDSNWWSDFPASAHSITNFYEKEGGETPDLILAMTPDLITDVLKITGPITLDRYKVTFTADNFVELTQVESSIKYDKKLNQPKQILADFVPALLQRLNSLKGQQLIPVITALQKALVQKQLLFYSRDPALQKKLDSFNWAGAIKQTDRDYLLISEANLGGTKTDTFLTKETSLNSEIGSDGTISNTITIKRTNPLATLPQFKQRSYLRIYVPKGSKLVEARGFTPVSLPPNNVTGDADPQVQQWEKDSVVDTVTGTFIGQESGKTVFGNWVEIPGGDDKTVTIKYTLPFRLSDFDHFSLLLQKQPGSIEGNFNYSIDFPNHKMEWKNVTLNSLDSHKLTLAEPLDKDHFFGFIFTRP